MKRVYLDNNATTPVDPEVMRTAAEAMELFGNPSSHYETGRKAKSIIDGARESVAAMIGADPDEILFTSCATESNNTVLRSFAREKSPCRIITTRIEHPAILATCDDLESMGTRVVRLPSNEEGGVSLADLEKALDEGADLVSAMMANNETGVMLPVAMMAEMARKRGAAFHTDAVQAAGKIKIDVRELGVDYLSISGHKMYAPKGIGVLYVRRGAFLHPLLTGGHQENGLRAGTENTPWIAAIGKAAEIASRTLEEESARIAGLRDRLEAGLLESIPRSYINGAAGKRVPNTLNISFDDIEGEAILYMLDHVGIEVSTGSACSSNSLNPSHVLNAMGISVERMHSSIRISLGKENTDEDVDYTLRNFPPVIARLRAISPFYK